jgi:hypothetical protein
MLKLTRYAHIRSMVGPPRGIVSHGFQWILYLKRRLARARVCRLSLARSIVPHGFQWVLSLQERLAMREVSLVPYKQPRPSSPNRCGIMASSEWVPVDFISARAPCNERGVLGAI